MVARDRPSRYGKIGTLRLNVGQGPVPCQPSGSSNGCEGQALALRENRNPPVERRAGACPLPAVGVVERLRGTGPRATVT